MLVRLVTSGKTFELKRIGDNYHPLVDGALPTGNVPVPIGSHTVGLDVQIDGAFTLVLNDASTPMPALASGGNGFAITKLLLGIVETTAQQATVEISHVKIER